MADRILFKLDGHGIKKFSFFAIPDKPISPLEVACRSTEHILAAKVKNPRRLCIVRRKPPEGATELHYTMRMRYIITVVTQDRNETNFLLTIKVCEENQGGM